jgi:hypothetical protein
MIHHYLHRGNGITLSELVNCDANTKLFLKVSMVMYYEEEAKRWGTT